MAVAMPYWAMTWDVFVWMGHRRFAKHWSVPMLLEEMDDRFGIRISHDMASSYLDLYQRMVAGRQADMRLLAAEYEGIDDLVLTIDGLQPEKGHETLYVVRELHAKRVWFAQPLLSSAKEQLRRVFEQVAQMVGQLGKPVRCWMSDKQDAFVSQIAEVFPGVPHRYCQDHFLRDLAKPVRDADSQAKVQMRHKVRGLRKIERQILAEAAADAQDEPAAPQQTRASASAPTQVPVCDERQQAVLDMCAAVRGVLCDDQGDALDLPGLRMAENLHEIAEAATQMASANKAGSCDQALNELSLCIHTGIALVEKQLTDVQGHVRTLHAVWLTLEASTGSNEQRKARFDAKAAELAASDNAVELHMAKTMASFAPGLFAGGDDPLLPKDNQDLERSFRLPKGRERRIHGHAHAGVRIVSQGATLLPVLDAHLRRAKPFLPEELAAYVNVPLPACQLESQRRHKIMHKARSRKRLPALLESIKAAYLRQSPPT
jgi:hypothetical protein